MIEKCAIHIKKLYDEIGGKKDLNNNGNNNDDNSISFETSEANNKATVRMGMTGNLSNWQKMLANT